VTVVFIFNVLLATKLTNCVTTEMSHTEKQNL